MKNILNYQTHLAGPDKQWIIFLHGAGGNIHTWKYQKDTFKNHYNLLMIDLRDHGESKNIAPPHNEYNFDIIVDDILKVVKEVEIDSAHFISLSFGSVLLQSLSIRSPQLVQSAVFAGGIFKPNISIKAFVHLARFFNLFLPYKLMYSIFSYLLMPLKSHQHSRKVYKKQAEKLSRLEYMKWVGLYREFFRLLNKFFNQKIHFPALVVMGEHDFVFLKSARRFSNKHRNVDLKIIPSAGHICNIDTPQEFNEVSSNFFVALSQKENAFSYE